MSITCDAIVEDGVLRPLSDLGLPNSERVRLTIERLGRDVAAKSALETILAERGVRRLTLEEASDFAGCDVSALSPDVVNRSLPMVISGKPLSATVIEERNEGW
jgi:predicted DNA-binding antitoxin AbrB/MazE fold protein